MSQSDFQFRNHLVSPHELAESGKGSWAMAKILAAMHENHLLVNTVLTQLACVAALIWNLTNSYHDCTVKLSFHMVLKAATSFSKWVHDLDSTRAGKYLISNLFRSWTVVDWLRPFPSCFQLISTREALQKMVQLSGKNIFKLLKHFDNSPTSHDLPSGNNLTSVGQAQVYWLDETELRRHKWLHPPLFDAHGFVPS